MARDRERQVIKSGDVGTVPAEITSPPTPPTDDTPKDTGKGFSVEVYQHERGRWSFRINGQESHYRSSHPDGLNGIIKTLLVGPDKTGTVKLPAMKADAKAKLSGDVSTLLKGLVATNAKDLGLTPEMVEEINKKLDGPVLPSSNWTDLPTQQERVTAFLSRGKLGQEIRS